MPFMAGSNLGDQQGPSNCRSILLPSQTLAQLRQ